MKRRNRREEVFGGHDLAIMNGMNRVCVPLIWGLLMVLMINCSPDESLDVVINRVEESSEVEDPNAFRGSISQYENLISLCAQKQADSDILRGLGCADATQRLIGSCTQSQINTLLISRGFDIQTTVSCQSGYHEGYLLNTFFQRCTKRGVFACKNPFKHKTEKSCADAHGVETYEVEPCETKDWSGFAFDSIKGSCFEVEKTSCDDPGYFQTLELCEAAHPIYTCSELLIEFE